jgi:lipoprotein signal peptidase
MPAATPRTPARPAFRSAAAVALFLLVAGAMLTADLLSKHVVFESLLGDANCLRRMNNYLSSRPGAQTKEILGCFQRDVMPGVRWTLSVNPGVVFGTEWFPHWAVKAATVLAILLIALMFACSDRRAWPTHLALGSILAGALGNLYDRLFSEVLVPAVGAGPIRGHVRDFIDLSQLHYRWVFNVADALLVIGVAILMLQWLRHSRARTAQAPAPDGAKPD